MKRHRKLQNCLGQCLLRVTRNEFTNFRILSHKKMAVSEISAGIDSEFNSNNSSSIYGSSVETETSSSCYHGSSGESAEEYVVYVEKIIVEDGASIDTNATEH